MSRDTPQQPGLPCKGGGGLQRTPASRRMPQDTTPAQEQQQLLLHPTYDLWLVVTLTRMCCCCVLPSPHAHPPPLLSLPPQDKILQSMSRGQEVTVTNDGATILKSVYVDNPAAKVLVGEWPPAAAAWVLLLPEGCCLGAGAAWPGALCWLVVLPTGCLGLLWQGFLDR